MLVLPVVLNAQYSRNMTYKSDFYIGVNAGVSYYIGEGVATYLKSNGLDPLGSVTRLTMGYNVSPIIGVRAFFGLSQQNWPDTRLPLLSDNTYPVKSFGAENLTADITVNLSNWWIGYDQYRTLDISAFGGVGAGVLLHNIKSGMFSPIGRLGLEGDFHITPTLFLNVMGEANMVGDNYNDYVDGLPFDFYPVLSIGFTYHIPQEKLHLMRIPVKKYHY